MRPVVGEDGSPLDMMQNMDVGILEFKTLLTAEAEEISWKMISQVHNLSNSKISIEDNEHEKEFLSPSLNFKQF